MKYLTILCLAITVWACKPNTTATTDATTANTENEVVISDTNVVTDPNVVDEQVVSETEAPAPSKEVVAPYVVKTPAKTTSNTNSPNSASKPNPTTTKPATAPKPATSNNTVAETSKPTVKTKEVEVPGSKPEKAPVTVVEKKEVIKPEVEAPKKNLHDAFDEILREFVSADGRVNYAGIKSDLGKLNNYLSDLEATNVNSLGKNEKLAFWINAYNAFTIKKILDNYPLKSITDLDGGKPWDKKWIKLNGKTLSLNNIENDIIRPDFKEPRIHFAVNCAAKSCPPLLNRAFTAGKLESQLESQTKKFINNAAFNSLQSKDANISKIFDWYGVDFGNITTFLNKYSASKIDGSAKISFQEYNWALNK